MDVAVVESRVPHAGLCADDVAADNTDFCASTQRRLSAACALSGAFGGVTMREEQPRCVNAPSPPSDRMRRLPSAVAVWRQPEIVRRSLFNTALCVL